MNRFLRIQIVRYFLELNGMVKIKVKDSITDCNVLLALMLIMFLRFLGFIIRTSSDQPKDENDVDKNHGNHGRVHHGSSTGVSENS